jgi:23S rRNA (adenine2503-C2)-methyltransferase
LTPARAQEIEAAPVQARRQRVRLYDLTYDQLAERLRDVGLESYRSRQIFEWAYCRLASYPQMTSLSRQLRDTLAATLPMDPLRAVRQLETDDSQTIKTLYSTDDGSLLETVLMFYPGRVTVCVSCQVGCAVGCSFCATGLGGLQRNLSAGEMVAQVVDAARMASARSRTLTNIVMMGMGEPFHNYRETIKFIGILNDKRGMNVGARRFTVSTSGIIPGIQKLAEEPYQVNLAVSLHAPSDALRDSLVPINLRFPIADLIAACRDYSRKTGRRVSFEYALMKGINDSDEVAFELARLIKGMLCHVNIIPLNPVDVLPYERPSHDDVARFARTLEQAGIPTTVRYSRGVEIAAACGQLWAQQKGLGADAKLPA